MFYKNFVRSVLSKYDSFFKGTEQKKVHRDLGPRRNVYIIVMNPKLPAAGSVLSLGVA
jgi:hypothetical protein